MKEIKADIKPQKLDAVIQEHARTGRRGDGKIYMSRIEDAVRIAAGERVKSMPLNRGSTLPEEHPLAGLR